MYYIDNGFGGREQDFESVRRAMTESGDVQIGEIESFKYL